MLSFDTVHALTGCLVHAEADVEATGWGYPPLLALLHDQPYALADGYPLRRVRADLVPINPTDLADHPTGLPGHLADIAAHLAAGRRPAAAAAAAVASLPQSHPSRLVLPVRALAWAVLYEDIATHADGPDEVRRVDAVDTDGRVYQLTRRRGETTAVVLVDEQPDPADTPATVSPLAALLSATSVPATQVPAPPAGARVLTAQEVADLLTTRSHPDAATGVPALDRALIAAIRAGHILACQLADGRISFTPAAR